MTIYISPWSWPCTYLPDHDPVHISLVMTLYISPWSWPCTYLPDHDAVHISLIMTLYIYPWSWPCTYLPDHDPVHISLIMTLYIYPWSWPCTYLPDHDPVRDRNTSEEHKWQIIHYRLCNLFGKILRKRIHISDIGFVTVLWNFWSQFSWGITYIKLTLTQPLSTPHLLHINCRTPSIYTPFPSKSTLQTLDNQDTLQVRKKISWINNPRKHTIHLDSQSTWKK
jgi:hypothetical protein